MLRGLRRHDINCCNDFTQTQRPEEIKLQTVQHRKITDQEFHWDCLVYCTVQYSSTIILSNQLSGLAVSLVSTCLDCRQKVSANTYHQSARLGCSRIGHRTACWSVSYLMVGRGALIVRGARNFGNRIKSTTAHSALQPRDVHDTQEYPLVIASLLISFGKWKANTTLREVSRNILPPHVTQTSSMHNYHTSCT